MQTIHVDRGTENPNFIGKFMPFVIFLALLIVGAILISFVRGAFSTMSPALDRVSISQSTLEEKYGLRVNLIAVTAAGGMLDLRLKISDAEKAKLFLQDKKNYPVLLVGDGGVTLNVSEDTRSQPIKFENNGDLFLLFPNSYNAGKRGEPVVILFGDVALEPILAK